MDAYINEIVNALIGVLVTVVIGFIAVWRGKIARWLDAKATVEQRALLHKIAVEAAALAESAYVQGGGPAKLDAAIDYVSVHAAKYGIKVSAETIRAAIEKAVADATKGRVDDGGKNA